MKATIPVCGKFGLIQDQPAQELPPGAWSRALNVRFRNGNAERIEGETSILTVPSVTPYYVDSYQVGVKRYFIHAGLARVFADDGTTKTDITPAVITPAVAFTGAIDDRWSGGTLGGIWIANNNKEAPQYWAGTGVLAPLTAWPANTTAAVVRPFKNALIALDVTKAGTRYATMVKTSSFAVPGAVPASWDQNDATKEATEIDLAEEPSQLVDCLPMGDANIIYKESAMYAQTLGGALIWNYRRLPGSVGLLARGCVAETPIGHVLMSPGDVVIHSGQGPRSIIDGRNRNWLQRSIDSTNYKRSFVTVNPGRNEVWVCFPQAGSATCDLALIWNWLDDTWTARDLKSVTYGCVGRLANATTSTWSTITGTWADSISAWNSDPYSPADRRMVTCSTTPKLLVIDGSTTFDGVTFSSVLERTGDVQDDPSRVKVMKSIYPRVDGPTASQVLIEGGGAMDVEQGPTYPMSVTYTVGSTYKADGFANGRALAYRFTSVANAPFRIKSFDIEYAKAGLF